MREYMAWYKKSNSITYLDIGQDPDDQNPVFLWWWDGSFHVEQTTKGNYGHREAIHNYNDVICRGRFDPKTNMVSFMAMKGIPQEAVQAVKQAWPGATFSLFRQK